MSSWPCSLNEGSLFAADQTPTAAHGASLAHRGGRGVHFGALFLAWLSEDMKVLKILGLGAVPGCRGRVGRVITAKEESLGSSRCRGGGERFLAALEMTRRVCATLGVSGNDEAWGAGADGRFDSSARSCGSRAGGSDSTGSEKYRQLHDEDECQGRGLEGLVEDGGQEVELRCVVDKMGGLGDEHGAGDGADEAD